MKQTQDQLKLDDSKAIAQAAGLRYVRDNRPGIRRVASGKSFRYLDPSNRRIHDRETLARIKSLAIPPAWTDVWICPIPNGHIQATGRDSRGRKQYRYHAQWRAVRDETKYDRMIAFGHVLPRLRARVEADLSLPELPRPKVLATVVRLLETTLIRVGNEEYAASNGSFGLTTLRNHHIKVESATVHFAFRGKSGVRHRIDVHDRRLAKVVRRCRDLPGQELFQYVDDEGVTRTIDSADVNEYLREIAGEEFTAKDFRTWAGTVLMSQALGEFEAYETPVEAKHNVVIAVETVAERLGNTTSVCRKCYIHPAIVEAYLDESFAESMARRLVRRSRLASSALEQAEKAVLAFLEARLKKAPSAAAS
jgi:DNA topoisomerase-1